LLRARLGILPALDVEKRTSLAGGGRKQLFVACPVLRRMVQKRR
jgi:hypothetical protein